MSRILIAGCGYVGQAAADLFHQAGWKVEGWTSSAESAAKLSAKPYSVRSVDISQRKEVAGSAAKFDAIIHCASSGGGGAADYRHIYLQGVRNLRDLFPDATILFTSSTSVYAQLDGSWVSETSPAEPSSETGRILREAEELVLAGDGIVARLGGIYGPQRSALLERFLRGDAASSAAKPRFLNKAHRDDIATALVRLIERKHELQELFSLDARNIFNVVDDEPILLSDCYEWLARRLGQPVPMASQSSAPGKRGDSNKRVSNKKLRSLGWSPMYPTFADAMTRSILPSFSSVHV